MAALDLVPHDQVRYFVEGAPVLVLPALEEAGLPAFSRDDEGYVSKADGWRIVARIGILAVDGPDSGIPIEGDAKSRDLMAWCEAVDEHGGAVVLSFDGWDGSEKPDELLDLAESKGARGGFAEGVPPGS